MANHRPAARIALAALAAAGLLAGCASTTSRSPDARPLSSPGVDVPGLPSAGTTPPQHGRDDRPDAPVPTPPLTQAPAVATAFAAAWVRTDRPAQQWWAALAPLCEDGFAERLRTVDPANIPATRLTGPATAAAPAPGRPLRITVPTDAGTLTVTVTLGPSPRGWLVVDNDFTRSTR